MNTRSFEDAEEDAMQVNVAASTRVRTRRYGGLRLLRRLAESHALIVLGAALAACEVDAHDPRETDRDPKAIAGTTQALAGSTRGSECTPFMLQHYERAQTIAAALLNSDAYRACVRDRFEESYLDCYDDASFASLSSAATGALRALSEGTHIELDCTNREGGACGAGGACPAGTDCRDGYCAGRQDSAWLAPYLGWAPAEMTISGFWTRANWYASIVPERARNAAYPWDAVASNLVHEFSHTQGYEHVRDDECAMRLRGRAYYANGEPSAPYILGDCAGAAVQAIYRDGEELWQDCPGPEWVRLPSSYDRTANVATNPGTLLGAYSGSECVRARRHRASLATASGSFVQAVNGGGSTVTLDSPGAGDWETLYIVQRSRGDLRSTAVVNFRAGDGHLLRVDPATKEIRADGTSGDDAFTQFTLRAVGSAAAGTPISRDQVVTLESVGAGAMVRQPRGQSRLAAIGTTANATQLRLRMPERKQAIFLDSHAGQRVAYKHDASRELSTRAASGPGAPEAREEMFWVLDWNGGEIESGDHVSLEWSKSPLFVSTCASGSGNVRGNSLWSTQRCAQFRVMRASGTGPIVDGTPVLLYALDETMYLAAAGGRVAASSGAGAIPGATFTLRFVQGDAF